MCLRFRCSESGEGTDGGGKSDSNRVLPLSLLSFSLCVPGLIASLCFHLSFSASFAVFSSPLSLSSPLYFDLCAYGGAAKNRKFESIWVLGSASFLWTSGVKGYFFIVLLHLSRFGF